MINFLDNESWFCAKYCSRILITIKIVYMYIYNLLVYFDQFLLILDIEDFSQITNFRFLLEICLFRSNNLYIVFKKNMLNRLKCNKN